MSTRMLLLLILFISAVSLVKGDTSGTPNENNRTGRYYEQCLAILEGLCEMNGSAVCTDLVKLCGHLLKEHITEAHRPDTEKCPQTTSYKDLLQRRQKNLDDLEKSHVNRAKSVRLLHKWMQLTNSTERTQAQQKTKRMASTTYPPGTEPPSSTRISSTIAPPTEARRAEPPLRGMLPESQALIFRNPLEKRGRDPNTDYMTNVQEYRILFLETKQNLIMKWLVEDSIAFSQFLKYWKKMITSMIGTSRRPVGQ